MTLDVRAGLRYLVTLRNKADRGSSRTERTFEIAVWGNYVDFWTLVGLEKIQGCAALCDGGGGGGCLGAREANYMCVLSLGFGV